MYDRSYEIRYSRYAKTVRGHNIQNLRYDTILRHIPNNVSSYRLLDFGCGVGNFLERINNGGGIKAKGFDVNPYSKHSDIEVLFGGYDIVTFWDSLEHLNNPRQVILGLGPEYLFICTPSVDDWDGELRDLTSWRHYMPSEHCHYFGEKSLTKLLLSCDYKVLEVNYNESKERNSGGDRNILTIAAKTKG